MLWPARGESETSKKTCPAWVTGDYDDIKLENTGGRTDLQLREEMMAVNFEVPVCSV